MKIAYLDILYDGNNAFEKIAEDLNQHASESVTVDYHYVTGANNLEYIVFEELVLNRIILKINQLRIAGYDAVILGCFHDPAIDASRELYDDIIIAGPGESSVHLASILGKSYSIISVRRKTTEKMFENRCDNNAALSEYNLHLAVEGITLGRSPPEEFNYLYICVITRCSRDVHREIYQSFFT